MFHKENFMEKENLIGLTKEAAIAKCKADGFKVRVRTEDGKGLMGTCDYRMDRFNLHIDNGLVTSVTKG